MLQIKKLQQDYIREFYNFLCDEGFSTISLLEDSVDTFVCIDNNRLCGFITGLIKSSYLFIKNIYIIPSQRRKYLGTSLIKAILNSADLKGADHAYIYGEYDDFYKKVGFKKNDGSSNSFIDNNYICEVYGQTFLIELYYINIKEYFKNLCCK